MQYVRRSYRHSPRQPVAVSVRANWVPGGIGRGIDHCRAGPDRDLADRTVLGTRSHCFLRSTARLARSIVFASWNCRFVAAIVGMSDRLVRNFGNAETDPRSK